MLKKLFQALCAQYHKLLRYFKKVDPLQAMQQECRWASERLKEGRIGLERYRGLVERVKRQVARNKQQKIELEANILQYLQAGDREIAGKFALELERAEIQLAENESQLQLHRESFTNNLLKLRRANEKLEEIKQRMLDYDATLKLAHAEAEITKLAQSLQFDSTTNLGQIEELIQEKIDQSRAELQVAADLSSQGLEELQLEEATSKARAESILKKYEPLLEKK